MAPPSRPGRPCRSAARAALLAAIAPVAVALLVAGCGGDEGGADTSRADQVALARAADPDLTDDQAGCLVDQTTDQLGRERSAELAQDGFAGSGLSDEVESIRNECLADAAAPAATAPATVPAEGAYPAISPDAQRYGDDPTLDRLWDVCEQGSGQACDDLYYLAPLDSEYEAFGYSCGDRPEIILCSELDR